MCDLATTLARDVPFRVMLGVLGLEEAVAADGDVDIETLTRWSATSLELFWGRLDEDREEELARDAADFYAWLTRLVQRGPTTTRAPCSGRWRHTASRRATA